MWLFRAIHIILKNKLIKSLLRKATQGSSGFSKLFDYLTASIKKLIPDYLIISFFTVKLVNSNL